MVRHRNHQQCEADEVHSIGYLRLEWLSGNTLYQNKQETTAVAFVFMVMYMPVYFQY